MPKNSLIDKFKPSEPPIRTFVYPRNAEPSKAIRLTLRYTSPRKAAEIGEAVAVRMTREDDTTIKTQSAKNLEGEVQLLLEAIVSVEDVTFGQLAEIVPLNAEAVKAAGGLTAKVQMAKENGGDEWTRYLLEESTPFRNFVAVMAGDIKGFQDDDWKDRLKN